MNTNPIWKEEVESVSYPPLDGDLHVDALIIGGGITGVTAAHAMVKAGLKVALVERDSLGNGDTSHTTAHLTYMTDTRLSELVKVCGKENAATAWKAGREAMDHIRNVIAELNIEASLTRVPGFLVAHEHADVEEERSTLKDEVKLANEMGFDVEYLESIAPTNLPGIRFPDQLKFHPLRYIQALAREAEKLGAEIHEQTNVTAFGENPRHAIANGHTITYDHVFIATHVPLQGNSGTIGAALFQTKLASYSTYAIAARYPKGSLEEKIWSDTEEPFNYFRVDRTDNGDLVIFGGADHKTGQVVETGDCFSALEATLARHLGEGEITHRWSGQVVETIDGLPFIGETTDGQFIATGFSGNGMTLGTIAALMACDHFTGKENAFKKAFDPSRRKLAATATYLSENKDFPYHMVKDRLAIPDGEPGSIAPGEGCVLKIDGEIIAACRDANGELHQISAICPHMGCIVAWNEGEHTWDCPCHGSRFMADGKLIAGPAEKDLQPLGS